MSRPRFRAYPVKGPRTEAGAALLAFLLVLLVGGSYALLGDAKSLAQHAKLEESRKTSEALAEAKAALIGYAVSRGIDRSCTAPGNNCRRPGDLPCPDRNNDGCDGLSPCPTPPTFADGNCGNRTGSTVAGQVNRLARLPWKTLGLGDLRDGAGERLWYAVSTNFKTNTRSRCTTTDLSGCLNSDTRGTITVRIPESDTDGDGDLDTARIVYDGRNPDEWTPSGAVAVVIAPGKVLQRQRTSQDQNRSGRDGRCSSATSPACVARNYLDVGVNEDNADFYDGPTVSARDNGFIAGEVLGNCNDGDCDVIVNDRVLPITYQDIIPLLEKRVVGEVLACLRTYDLRPPSDPTVGPRYPWAAQLGATLDYDDDEDTQARFGRIPDVPFEVPFNPAPELQMPPQWALSCPLLNPPASNARWWLNWKELVFYGVAKAYEPQPDPPQSTPDPCGAEGKCLAVNPPLPPSPDPLPPCVGSTRVVVIASGKRLPAVPDSPEPQTAPSAIITDQKRQSLAEKGDTLNYFESYNATVEGDSLVDPQGPCSVLLSPSYVYFRSGNATNTFNDVVGYLPPPQP